MSAIYLPKITAAFKAYLEHVTITAFRSPARLIEHIRNGNSCDLLFVDIDMPEMSGIELCRSLQAQGHSIPVVFFSNMEERVFETFEFPTVFFCASASFAPSCKRSCSERFGRRCASGRLCCSAQERRAIAWRSAT